MKRYNPDLKMSYERSWGDWVESYDPIMVEMRSGMWTPWQNAHDTVMMYQKRIARLEARLARMEDELFLLKANISI